MCVCTNTFSYTTPSPRTRGRCPSPPAPTGPSGQQPLPSLGSQGCQSTGQWRPFTGRDPDNLSWPPGSRPGTRPSRPKAGEPRRVDPPYAPQSPPSAHDGPTSRACSSRGHGLLRHLQRTLRSSAPRASSCSCAHLARRRARSHHHRPSSSVAPPRVARRPHPIPSNPRSFAKLVCYCAVQYFAEHSAVRDLQGCALARVARVP